MKKQIVLLLFWVSWTILILSSCTTASPVDTSSAVSTEKNDSPGTLPDISMSLCTQPVSEVPPTAPSEKIRMTFAGDCSFGAINGFQGPRYFPEVYQASRSISYPFDRVKSIFEADDLTVVNFEGTLTTASEEADKQWHFKGDPTFAVILPAASVDVALLTNNHAGDYLEKGYADTVLALRGQGVGLVEESAPFVTQIRGVSVVIIGDCAVIGEDTPHTDGVAERVLAQIQQWKTPETIVVVDLHWGSENTQVPSEWQRASARAFIDAGADLIIGQHPHILQGMETYRGKPIVYSLGNFAFGGNCLAKEPETMLYEVVFRVDADGVSIDSANVIPCRITSSTERNDAGFLWNNFQPEPLSGSEAEQVLSLIESRSARLQPSSSH